jgi:hypothetical protein
MYSFLDEIDFTNVGVASVAPAFNAEKNVAEIDSDYYNDRSAWSNSMAKELAKDEVAFHKWFTTNEERPCDDKFAVGQYLHTVLENALSGGNEIPMDFIILPKLDMRTKAGKEKYAELTQGKDLDKVYVVSESDARRVEALVERFLRSDTPEELGLVGGSFELEKAFTSEYRGVRIKGRIDCVTDDCVIDWKTTSSYSDWANKARFYDYDQQAAWYLKLTGKSKFKFVVFDTVNFNRWFVAEASPQFLKRGADKMDDSICLIKEYLTKGINSGSFRNKILL